MFRIDNATAKPTLDAAGAAGTQGYFTDGDPGALEPPTILPAWFMNMLMLELKTVVEAAGLTLDKADNTQVSKAIAIRAPDTFTWSNQGT